MSPNDLKSLPGPDGRSEVQRQRNAAMVQVMKAWEALSDEERLTWDVHGAQRRMMGINAFKQVNLRRLRREEELVRVPSLCKPHDARPLLKGLDIRNRDGRITLELQLRRVPDSPRTVWASLPCNRGLKQPRRCPRLGWLPAPRGRWCEITKLYFKKHGEYIKQHGLELVGKRIFVRIRPETDDGPNLYEQIKALVPQPEVQMDKKGISPSKDRRRSIEGSSNQHASNTPPTRHPQAAPPSERLAIIQADYLPSFCALGRRVGGTLLSRHYGESSCHAIAFRAAVGGSGSVYLGNCLGRRQRPQCHCRR